MTPERERRRETLGAIGPTCRTVHVRVHIRNDGERLQAAQVVIAQSRPIEALLPMLLACPAERGGIAP